MFGEKSIVISLYKSPKKNIYNCYSDTIDDNNVEIELTIMILMIQITCSSFKLYYVNDDLIKINLKKNTQQKVVMNFNDNILLSRWFFRK